MIQRSSKDFQTHKTVANSLFARNQYAEAEHHLKKALQVSKDKRLMYMLSECLGKSGKVDQQCDTLSEIVALFPDEIENIKEIGLLQFEKANFTLAHFCLARAVQSGIKTREVLEKLRISADWTKAMQLSATSSVSTSPRPETISVCLMVRNEEDHLAKCLTSIQSCTQEIIVVDTGSTDASVRIAKDFGANVYHHPWIGDFSGHRNQSMSYATGSWILMIDADEALDPQSARRVPEVIAKTKCNAVLLKVVNLNRDGGIRSLLTSPRLLRNHAGCHYRGIVHNQAWYPGPEEPSSLTIYHYGYDQDPQKMKSKSARTIGLLRKQIEADPEALFPRINMATSRFVDDDFQNAILEGEKAIDLIRKEAIQRLEYASVYYTVSAAYFNLGHLEKAQKVALDGLTYSPENMDLLLVLATTYERQEDYRKALTFAKRYLVVHKQLEDSAAKSNMQSKTFGRKLDAWLLASFASQRIGRIEDSVTYFEQACEFSSPDAFPPAERLKFSIKIGAYEKAQDILNALKSRIPACDSLGANNDQRIPDV
jgi:glycosyltransferase involved in cell wall biosynthesis